MLSFLTSREVGGLPCKAVRRDCHDLTVRGLLESRKDKRY